MVERTHQNHTNAVSKLGLLAGQLEESSEEGTISERVRKSAAEHRAAARAKAAAAADVIDLTMEPSQVNEGTTSRAKGKGKAKAKGMVKGKGKGKGKA